MLYSSTCRARYGALVIGVDRQPVGFSGAPSL